MFLKNYYKNLGMFHANNKAGVLFTAPDGSEKEVWHYESYSKDYAVLTLALTKITDLITSYGSYAGVLLGDGNVPPTPSDYRLSGNIITGVVMSASTTATSTEDGVEKTVLYTVTNNNSKAITIGEIGYLVSVYGMTKSGGTSACNVLVERTALDVPITIEPGGVGQITYTLRMNYPT